MTTSDFFKQGVVLTVKTFTDNPDQIDVQLESPIDYGASGAIFKGRVIQPPYGPRDVALKIMVQLPGPTQEMVRRELKIVKELSERSIQKHILPFIGTTTFMGFYTIIVADFMRNGNMVQYFKQNPDVDRQHLLIQVAEAVYWLHECMGLVHGDLKCENVLINDEENAVLADFGLATLVEKAEPNVITSTAIRNMNTLRFAAPEVLFGSAPGDPAAMRARPRSKTRESDVYAFGMLVLQAFTDTRPWPHLGDQEVLRRVFEDSAHPRPPDEITLRGLTDSWWTICLGCWRTDPKLRPTMKKVWEELERNRGKEFRGGFHHEPPLNPCCDGAEVLIDERHNLVQSQSLSSTHAHDGVCRIPEIVNPQTRDAHSHAKIMPKLRRILHYLTLPCRKGRLPHEPDIGNSYQVLPSTPSRGTIQISDPQTPHVPTLGYLVHDAETVYAGANPIGEHPSNPVQLSGDGSFAADEWSDRIDSLFAQISAFCNKVGVIGEFRPYAKIVTGLQAGIESIMKQKARDGAMQKLINYMTFAYDAAMADDQILLESVKDGQEDPRCGLLAALAQQTAECAVFIQEVHDTKSSLNRTPNTVPRFFVELILHGYSAAFAELGRKIAHCDLADIKIPLTTVSISVVNTDLTLTLQELSYAVGTGRQKDKGCLTGTRVATLDCLADWIFHPDATRVRFVVGVAGSGKSSIAHSIASRLEAFGRLGAFFAFDRTNERLAPWSMFSTVARELADWNADFKRELCAVLSESGRLAKSGDVIEQWENLIVRPAQKVHWVGPVLVVVDAFDECADLTGPPAAFNRIGPNLQSERENLLEALTNRAGDLPANFRILVTSRLESDVATALLNNTITIRDEAAPQSFDYIDLSSTVHDPTESISVYIHHEMERHLDNKQIDTLVVAADGLFEWAATVCRLLNLETGGSTVAERYKKWLEVPSASGTVGFGKLETLYAEILGRQFPDEVGIDRFRSVMAQVLYSAELLSIDTLRALRRGANDSDSAVDRIIPYLGSLLSGVGDPSEPIQPLHTSFRDFLTRADPPHAWHVAPGDVHGTMALGALRVLNTSLHFDMWSFHSSYIWNDEIQDVDDRMRTLPAGLIYASRHWGYHLSMASKSAVILQTELRLFLTQKLLFWLEVVSLCGIMHIVVSSLLTAVSFFKPLHDDDVIAFINDAISFAQNFLAPMQYSVPHIYLSALAFCPTTSLIRRSFVRNSSLLPTIDGLTEERAVALCPHRVRCLAYSPDGIYLALGCMDGDVRLVEADNMHNSLLELSRAPGSPTLWFRSVAFSPDGQIVAAAAQTLDVMGAILRWNAETGEMLGISHGHIELVNSVFFSPDGRSVVSASDDGTVRRWDARTGEQVGDPLRGHTGRVVGAVYSLNGEFILSAGADATIRIWSADNGQQDGPPILTPGRGPARALTRSPKRNLIAVGITSQDSSSVWVFDFDQRCFVRELARQHQNGLLSIAWSYDGRWIASAFAGGSILLWDGFDSSSTALYPDTPPVKAVDFSPNSQRLLLTHLDGTFSAVDVAMAQSASPEHHAGPAEYAAYSPDGRFAAVTFSGKKFPHVWDRETGRALSDQSVLTASLTWLKPAMDRPLQHYDIFSGWLDRLKHRPHDIVSANGLRSAGVRDKEISIWDSASQTLLEPSIRVPSGYVSCVALSPSGDSVLQGSSDGTVRIYHVDQSADNTPLPAEDSASGAQRSNSPEGEHSMPVLRPGWSAGWLCDNDGRRIISVPEQYRADLWVPGLVHILLPNREPARPVKIDVSGVGLGTEWKRCAGALSVDLGNAPMSSEPVAYD